VTGSGTRLSIRNFNFGSCPGGHVAADQGCTLIIGGTWIISGGCAGSVGGNGSHISANIAAQIQSDNTLAINVTVAVSFAAPFVVASFVSVMQVLYQSLTGGANVNASRYLANSNAVISTNGGGANYYPGTSPGTAPNGLYI
jgi:hypothetical protein